MLLPLEVSPAQLSVSNPRSPQTNASSSVVDMLATLSSAAWWNALHLELSKVMTFKRCEQDSRP